jgi:branched-subunit amino acid ABC-type transport system permease component
VITQQLSELIADAMVRGSTIALLAVGLTLVYGTMRFANVAHVEFATVGAYATVSLSGVFVVPVAGIIGAVVAVTVGVAVYELVFRRLLAMGEMSAMIGSLAVSIVVQAAVQLAYGSRPRDLPRELEQASRILGAAVTPSQIQLVAVSVVALVLTGSLLRCTPLGRKVRAVAANPELARVSGVGERRILAAVWAIAGGLAAIGGIELALESTATPALGFNLLLPVFSAAIVGGLGSVAGAVIASYGVAFLEALVLALDVAGSSVPVSYRPAIGFVFLILALVFRPHGLLGTKVRLV